MNTMPTPQQITGFFDGGGDAKTRATVAQYLYENDAERALAVALNTSAGMENIAHSPAVRCAVLERFAPDVAPSLADALVVWVRDALRAVSEGVWLPVPALQPAFVTRGQGQAAANDQSELGWQRQFGRFKVVIRVLRIRDGFVNLSLEISDPTKNELPEMRAELLKGDDVLESRLLHDGKVVFESHGVDDYTISVFDIDGERFAFRVSLKG